MAINDLLSGKIDFALGYTEFTSAGNSDIEETDWLTDRYVVIASTATTIPSPLTLEHYLQARHIVVTPWNQTQGMKATLQQVADK